MAAVSMSSLVTRKRAVNLSLNEGLVGQAVAYSFKRKTICC